MMNCQSEKLKGLRIAFHTLGCKVNQYETEVMENESLGAGAVIVPFTDEADIYVVNTCTVTNIADRKSRQMLHRARNLAPKAVIVAAGCYTETGDKAALYASGVDLVLGNERKKDFVETLSAFLKEKKLPENPDINKVQGYRPEFLTKVHEHTRAELKVQDGCNEFCSYCLIPYARGRIRSKAPEAVLEEIRALTANGIREFVLTGIHLSSYGKDLPEGEDLLSLIRAAAAMPGVERLRLGSLEPRVVTETFARELSKIPEICPHFHLSLQSGSASVLRRMNRKYTPDEYREALRLLREAFDRPAITTDVIVGFPKETEEEFRESLEFVREAGFYELHVFQYSRRKGTAADRMSGQVPDEIKKRRSAEMIALGEEMSEAYRRDFLGRMAEALAEEPDPDHPGFFGGYTREYIRVLMKADEAGEIVRGRLKLLCGSYAVETEK